MKTNHKSDQSAFIDRRFKATIVCGIVLTSFAAGSLITRLMYPKPVRAENSRVFELMVYHSMPGKVPALESIFRNVSKLQDKHGINVVGYWIPDDKDPFWADTFVYLVAHPDREGAEKNWKALHSDPAFLEYRKQATQIIERSGDDYRVDEVYMKPTDYSAMK